MTRAVARHPARPVTPAGILAQRLAALASSDPLHGRDLVELQRELHELAVLAGGLEEYAERNTTEPSMALAALAEVTRCHDWGGTGNPQLGLEQEMLSGQVEGQLLSMLVAVTGARRVLEIGMFTGYAALAMAEALPAGGQVVTCEIDASVAALAQRQFAHSAASGRIDVRVGPAAQTLQQLASAGDRFDLVFVDADKAGYIGYVDAVLSAGLLADNGLLCIDNTLMQGQPWAGPATPNGQAIAEFNEWLRADDRVTQVLVPLRDGLTLARRSAPHMTS